MIIESCDARRTYTVKEAAKSLGVGTRVVYRMIESGALVAKKNGVSWQISGLPISDRPLTPKAIAISHGVSVRLIQRMIKDGRVLAIKIGRKKLKISREEASKLLLHPHFLR